MKLLRMLGAVIAFAFGVACASEFDIVGSGATEADALANAEAKVQAMIAKKAQQAANHAACLCPILRDFDPLTEFNQYKAAWEAAKRGEYTASAQGITVHQLMCNQLTDKSFNVRLTVAGKTQPARTWRVFAEVQIGKENNSNPLNWTTKGQIYGLGQSARKSNVLIADVMILEGAEPIASGQNISSMTTRWQMGIDYKTVRATSTVKPAVSSDLAQLLEDELGALAAKKYRAMKVLRPNGMGPPSVPVIEKTLKLQFPDMDRPTRLKTAKKLAWRYGRFLLIAAGISVHAISTAADLPANSDRFLMEMDKFVAKCNSPAAPRYDDVEGVGEAMEKLYGLEPNSITRGEFRELLYQAGLNIHDSRGTEQHYGEPGLSDYLDQEPFVNDGGEIKIRFAETNGQ